jgi:hypothetical protein
MTGNRVTLALLVVVVVVVTASITLDHFPEVTTEAEPNGSASDPSLAPPACLLRGARVLGRTRVAQSRP